MGTRTISGTIYHPGSGLPWASGIIKFVATTTFVTSERTYSAEKYSVTLDSNGQFIVVLAVPDTGSITYLIELPSNESYSVPIAAGAAITLEELLASDWDSSTQSTLQTAIDAHAAITIGVHGIGYDTVTSVTSDTTLTALNRVVLVNGECTITLPTAVDCEGRRYTIKNIGDEAVTIATTLAQTIDGQSTQVIAQYDSIDVISDDANWWIL